MIFMLVKGKTKTAKDLKTVQTNHLHELPAMAEDMRAMTQTLQRIETPMAEDFSYLKARLNGRS